MSTLYLNGEFLAPELATVSVMDRGFLFGDGVYEVIPAYGGRPFRLAGHLQRLRNSLQAIRVREPMSDAQWRVVLEELLRRNPGEDQSIYLQVTRGVMAKRDHTFDDSLVPTVFAMVSPIAPPDPAIAREGVRAVTRNDIRWQSCHIKAITLLPNVLLRQEAIDSGAVEAILVRDGHATEGAASNLFIIHNGVLITPPKGPYLLPGITRDLILELAARHAIPYREAGIRTEDLANADEIWLTSSTKEILPVTTLDGKPVADGRPGALYRRMGELYRAYKDQVRTGAAE